MIPTALQSTQALTERIGAAALARSIDHGSLVRIRQGWHVPSASWHDAVREERHRLLVHAAAGSMRGADQVFSYYSAAVLHRLPTVKIGDPHVHITSATKVKTRTTGDVRRHADTLDPADIVAVEDLPCTSLERTVFDVGRTASGECAITVVDAALRLTAWNDRAHEYDEEAAAAWKSGMMRRISRSGGVRGTRQLRWAVAFGDGRAQLPGESVTRLRLWQLGFAPPRLQVPVPAPGGGWYYVDQALDDVRAWLEFDGEVKYTDPAILAGRTAAEVVEAQERRERWICEATGWPMVRCRWADAESPQSLSRHLAAQGIRPPR